jgi:hypothetical protein
MSQRGYPFECAIAGVAQREDFATCEEEQENASEAMDLLVGDRWRTPAAALPPSDVFVVEGGQLRYGNQDAWKVARRR